VTFWQKPDNVDGKKNKLKTGGSLKIIEKKFKDLESASASHKRRSRKRSSSYTSDPCTPPKDMQTEGAYVDTTPMNNASDDATEHDKMLVADEDNYLKTQYENTPDIVTGKSYFY